MALSLVVIALILISGTVVWFLLKRKEKTTVQSKAEEKDSPIDSDRSELVVDNPVYQKR